MSAPKKPTLEMEKLLEASGLSVLDLARESDKMARELAAKCYGPLPDERTPDVSEEIEMAYGMRIGMDDGGRWDGD